MSQDLAGKVALVTGGSSGIGRATALAFAQEGARVVVSDISVDGCNETIRLITEAQGEAIFVRADMSVVAEIEAMVATTIKTYGRLDFAFNNAGIEGESTLTADCTEANWERTIAINLTGVWRCMKAEIPHMLASGGVIVNCSSVAGLVGFNALPAYVASKHGVVGLTKTAALDYATAGIRVNAVCPGVIATPMVERFTHGDPAAQAQMQAMEPVGRLGTSDEIAGAVIWLCSDAASFVTGVALPVDGGFVAR